MPVNVITATFGEHSRTIPPRSPMLQASRSRETFEIPLVERGRGVLSHSKLPGSWFERYAGICGFSIGKPPYSLIR